MMSPATGPRSAEEVSLMDLLSPLVRRWKLLLGLPLALGFVVGLVSLVLPSVYTAQTTLTPVAPTSSLSGGALSSLAGLAGQLGVSTGGGGSVSPDFIANVLKSREVLTATLQSPFHTSSDKRELPLLEIMKVKGRTDAQRLSRGVRILGALVQTKVDRATGIVTLLVKQRDPNLAADIANQMRVILNDFNLERRQSQSREQARFTKERLTEAETELRQAEAAQLRFLQANRDYRGSPLLDFEGSRLQRTVDLRQEVYVSLVKAYDEARISEVRDTPVITTIDSAVAPDHRSAPRPALNAAIAVLAGGMVAFILVFLLEQRAQAAQPAASEPPTRQAPRGRESGREQSPAGV
ncbi:MAG: GNVR domain-containing protein [Gemmatimonadales bacterium]